MTDFAPLEPTEPPAGNLDPLLRLALEEAGDGITIADLQQPDAPLVFANAAFLRLTGYAPQEILGRNCRFLQGSETSPEAVARLRQAVRERRATAVTLRNYRKDGRPFWNALRLVPLRSPDGTVRHMLGLQHDISETEEQQRELAASLSSLLAASPLAMIGIDAEGRVTDWLGDAERLFGWTAREVVGLPPPFIPVQEMPQHLEKLERVLRRGDPYGPVETVRLRKDGSLVTTLLSAAPRCVAEGRIVGMVAVYADLSALAAARREAAAQAERFRDIAEHANDWVWETDADGRLTYSSSTGLRRLGFDADAALHGRELAEFAVPEQREAVTRRWATLREEQQAFGEWEVQFAGPDGRGRTFQLSGTPFRRADGTLGGFRGVATDVTSLRRYEARLAQAERLESLGTLASGIAHDFNNVLGAVVGYAEMAALQAPAGSELAEMLQRVQEAAERGRELSRRIVTFGRPDLGAVRSIDGARWLDNVLTLVGPRLREVHLVRRVAPGLPPLLGDETQLAQVLLNLLTNALDALADRARPEIEVDLSEVRPVPAEGRRVRLVVRDNGGGMPPATLERIFDPFFTTKADGLGSGLGLSVAYGIVRAHGGTIRAESAPGLGTTFTVELPARVAEALPSPTAPVAMVVDDDADIGGLLAAQLGTLGWSVERYSDPHAALAALREAPGRFAFLLTDLRMPGLHGIDLLRAVRPLAPDLAVLVCTGFAAEFDVAHARELGVTAVLQKPFSLGQLRAAIPPRAEVP
ncbi:MAG: PAS domain S-box protein [Gemmatimonadales bacterium]|nr:PAS domain S-box protein [Gemmatimonadales bacterium]